MILNIQFISHRKKNLDFFPQLAPVYKEQETEHKSLSTRSMKKVKERIQLCFQLEHNWNYCFESEFYVAFIQLWAHFQSKCSFPKWVKISLQNSHKKNKFNAKGYNAFRFC